MKVLRLLGFYSHYINSLHVSSQPFHDLIRLSTSFHWTKEHENLFQAIEHRIGEDTDLAVPSTEYPFHIHIDSSNVGTGCILIQHFPRTKKKICFNSRVYYTAEQKTSTLHKQLCRNVLALQIFEDYITGSPFAIYFHCDHKPILYLRGRREQLFHRFFKYQVINTKFQNLKIIWKPCSKLAFPYILSRNLTIDDYQKHQLQHRRLPRDIEYFHEDGNPVTYKIQLEEKSNDSQNKL